jgi:hypothetical protein
MSWEIEVTGVYDAWFDSQANDVQDAILAHLKALAVEGPNLGRPYCDTLHGTRLGKLKELRVQASGDPYRVLFAFDSERCAVLLLGGNKRGNKRWYDIHIPLAEKLFDAWEEQRRRRAASAAAQAKSRKP